MNFPLRKIKPVVYLCAAVLIAASMAGAGVATRKRAVRQQKQERHLVTDTLPQVIHKVKDLKVVKAAIEDQGKPSAEAVFEIANNSDLPVTAFTLTFGSVSVGRDGGISVDEPVIVIEPRGTTTLEIPVSNFDSDIPIIVAAVVYADGTEDGPDVVLEMMHQQRAKAKAERDAKRKGAQK